MRGRQPRVPNFETFEFGDTRFRSDGRNGSGEDHIGPARILDKNARRLKADWLAIRRGNATRNPSTNASQRNANSVERQGYGHGRA